ncbi:MAG: hypothetical protein CMJ36_02475 [Phycisphaerae bacterium]|nr:hypothetical protein [Phycisphaerae bacterium]
MTRMERKKTGTVAGEAPRQPRRAGRGGKLRLEPEVMQSHPVAGAWLESVRSTIGDANFEWGLKTARSGRVRVLEIGPGLVSANVSEEGGGGKRVIITVPMLTDIAWARLEERMAAEAVWTARLSEGECPENLTDLFADCGVTLAPSTDETLSCRMNGPADSGQRRAGAVAWLAAERFTIEPLAMLEVRGRSVTRIVERIRRHRALDLSGGAHAHPDPIIPFDEELEESLNDSVEHFWRSKFEFNHSLSQAPTQHVPHALLRRLGPSTMEGKFPLAGLLATIYDHVSERSRAMLEDGAG